MIIVTGTKRSGTSMWMQILKQAGLPVLGRRFPRDWAETIRDANRAGFYESPLRHGIHAATNPNPRSGLFLAPEETRRHVVKVFAQGLARTELAYVDFVIACVRDPREYEASLARLYAMERDNKFTRAEQSGRSRTSVPVLSFAPAVLEWWHDNYTLLSDAERRGYAIRFVSYAAVLREPERTVGEVLGRLGEGDRSAAVAAVREELRTQHAVTPASAVPIRVCDELYQRLDQGIALDAAFRRRLARAHEKLLPRILAAERAARAARKRERQRARASLHAVGTRA